VSASDELEKLFPGAKVTRVNDALREAVGLGAKRKRGHKYGAVKTTVDGITFDSKREASRWSELKLLEQKGEIRHLRRQVQFDLVVSGLLVTRYRADFEYTDAEGNVVTEDAKGLKTPEYEIKKKLMLACHNITIRES
jgi:hypothetical protein